MAKNLVALLLRVARWYILKPKIQIWVNFRGHEMENFAI
jgi:hypothetical protein